MDCCSSTSLTHFSTCVLLTVFWFHWKPNQLPYPSTTCMCTLVKTRRSYRLGQQTESKKLKFFWLVKSTLHFESLTPRLLGKRTWAGILLKRRIVFPQDIKTSHGRNLLSSRTLHEKKIGDLSVVSCVVGTNKGKKNVLVFPT